MNQNAKSVNQKVIFIKQNNYEPEQIFDQLINLVEPFGGWKALISKGDKVILKPNLVASSNRLQNTLTDPAIIESIIRILRNFDDVEIKLADSPGIESVKSVAISNGIFQMCQKYNVPVIPFKKADSFTIEGRKWSVSRELRWADKLINLPKLKGHQQLYYTGAVKNLFGCVSGKRKFMHHMILGDKNFNFAQMLLDVAQHIGPVINILDGIGAQAGRGPIFGTPVKVHLLAACKNPVSLDKAVCDWLNADLSRIPVFNAAADDRYWSQTLNYELNWIGDPFENKDFFFPEKLDPIRFNPYHSIKSVCRSLVGVRTKINY